MSIRTIIGELKIKPCPFCDGEAKIENAAECGPNAYVVACQNPMCMSSSKVIFADEDVTRQLVESWNRRTGSINASYCTCNFANEPDAKTHAPYCSSREECK